MSVGKHLRAWRRKMGKSQADIANYLNVSRQLISKWENDQSSPDIESLIALSQYYHISLDALVADPMTHRQEEGHNDKKNYNNYRFYDGFITLCLMICLIASPIVDIVMVPVFMYLNCKTEHKVLRWLNYGIGIVVVVQIIYFIRYI